MNKIIDYIDIVIAKLAIWSIRRGYGAECSGEEKDCAGCRAKIVLDWLEEHIKLIKY